MCLPLELKLRLFSNGRKHQTHSGAVDPLVINTPIKFMLALSKLS